MNNFHILGLIFSLIGLLSCQQTTSNKRFETESKFVQNPTFSKPETAQLLELLARFDKEICNKGDKEQSPEQCYLAFFEHQKERERLGYVDAVLDEEIHRELLELLDTKLKKEIWEKSTIIKWWYVPGSNNKQRLSDTLATLQIRRDGKYFGYLTEYLAKDSEKIKSQVDGAKASGTFFNPSGFADIYLNSEQYNIEDDRVRLFICIWYLTNDIAVIESNKSYKRLFGIGSDEYR